MNSNTWAEWSARLSLGVMYLYSGFDLYSNPRSWTQFMPYWFREMMRPIILPETFIKIQGPIEIIIALVLLAWFLDRRIVRVAAFISAFEMAGIILLSLLPFNSTNFLITFRDLGIFGASAALGFLLLDENYGIRQG